MQREHAWLGVLVLLLVLLLRALVLVLLVLWMLRVQLMLLLVLVVILGVLLRVQVWLRLGLSVLPRLCLDCQPGRGSRQRLAVRLLLRGLPWGGSPALAGVVRAVLGLDSRLAWPGPLGLPPDNARSGAQAAAMGGGLTPFAQSAAASAERRRRRDPSS